MRIPFGEWLPDQPPFENPGSANIKNVYPIARGYKPIKALETISTNALDDRARGAISAQTDSGGSTTFAGDGTKLYTISAHAWMNVSKLGGYSLATEEYWKFTQYGQRVLACTINEPIQYFDLDSSSLFANLAGSPPQARHIASVREFVVLANTTTSPSQVVWSGFNDSEGWSEGTNQSDAQTLLEGGWINGIIGGEVGYILQDRQITRMTYVGPPYIFQFDVVAKNRGCIAPNSVSIVGQTAYFLGNDGFYSLDLVTGACQPIGTEKVDRWFSDNFASGIYSRVTTGADPLNKLTFWGFVSSIATDVTLPDTLLVYNYAVQRFSYANVEHEMLFQGLSEGLTLEQLSAIYPVLEDVPASLDSRTWAGGAYQFSAFDADHMLAVFTGDNLEAILETTEFEGVPFKRSVINGVRPLVDTSAATVLIRSRERIANSPANSASGSMVSNGEVPLLVSGHYHRAQMTIPAATVWTVGQGIDVQPIADGAQ